MRRLILAAGALACCWLLVSAPAGCRRQRKVAVETIEDEPPELASMLHVADPKASLQLLHGFYDLEQNAWRWTKGKFSVTLRPPAGAAAAGAALELKMTVPDPVIERLKSVTLSANVNGTPIESETFNKPGEYTFRKDVPAKALEGEAVTVDFALDKFLEAGAVEQRELGIIVSTVGLVMK